jgi:hypothetical protein
MHPIQDLFLESVSYALQFDLHFYMHSYVEKKFILVKMGVTSGAQKLAGGGAKEREEQGELGSDLTRAQATAVQNQRRRRSVEARLECGEKRREVGRGAVKSGGGDLPFIGVGGAPGRGGRGLTPALMALTPLKMGGFNREIKRGGGMKAGW